MNTQQQEKQFKVGDETTCQMGNSGDTDWTPERNGNVPVEVLATVECEISRRTYYLVKEIGRDKVARASVARHNRHDPLDEPKLGELYSTNGRLYGQNAQGWTGIKTLGDAAHSLGFNAYAETVQ
jgi:hypothetical protein